MYCQRPVRVSAGKIDRLLMLGSVVERLLDEAHAEAAIVSRSGFDLSRFRLRYSHAGIALKDEARHAWLVRQLYFDCSEDRPRIYDQGMSGFVLGHDEDAPTFVSLVLLPELEETALERSAADNRLALGLLGARYSANAYPFSTIYQNCNQWVMELLAYAWGGVPEDIEPAAQRRQAQDWLKNAGYEATPIQVENPFVAFFGRFLPYLHQDDHPTADLGRNLYRVSMPASIEGFVRQRISGVAHVEICLKDSTILVRRGWDAIDEECASQPGDEVIPLRN